MGDMHTKGKEPAGEDAGYSYMRGWSKGESDLWADMNGFLHMQAAQWEAAGQHDVFHSNLPDKSFDLRR